MSTMDEKGCPGCRAKSHHPPDDACDGCACQMPAEETTPARDGRPGDLREAVLAVIGPMGDPMDPHHLHPQTASLILQLWDVLAEHPATPTTEELKEWVGDLDPSVCVGFPSTIRIHSTHADPDEYARIWNIGYEAAMTQHLADDPTAADDWLRDHDAALTAKAKAEALHEAADVHEAQLVCCDVFERLRDKPSHEWTDPERKEMSSHAICYWAAACAEGDRERADRMTP